jgi:hypothetical protein
MATLLKPSPGALAALAVTTLQSLATSSTWLAGWSSAVIDNTTNLSMDERISGKIFTGTSPTVSTFIEIWCWAVLDASGSPVYPDTIDGTESAKTLTSLNVKLAGAFRRALSITVDSTSNQAYPFAFSLSEVFSDGVPDKWGVFITHNTGVALKSTGQLINRTPRQYTNV